jgi:hypothetical protein
MVNSRGSLVDPAKQYSVGRSTTIKLPDPNIVRLLSSRSVNWLAKGR